MKFFLTSGSNNSDRARRGGASVCAAACALILFLCCLSAARAQSAKAPQPDSTPAASTPASKVWKGTPPQPASARPVPQVKPTRATTPKAPATTQVVQQPTPSAAPLPPRNVVTVVHRVDGWKLLAWIAARGGDDVLVDELPAAFGVHTNIVAGFVSDDGRIVVARLPRAEAEVVASTPTPAATELFPVAAEQEGPGFVLINSDGRRVEARFIGLDVSTGLSLLEASEPLIAPAPTPKAAPPAVGQRVRLYAPAPAAAPQPAVPAVPPAAPGAPSGDEGVVYLSIGETEGYLTDVWRAPSGEATQATVRASRITSAWTGAIATNETGRLVGIVGDTGHTESHIVPAEAVRLATERVLARRASVPQPWLGVRGEAVSRFSIEQFLAKGWPREFALPLLNNRQGVLLTGVAPGAPAALAGLKPGDIIASVGGREVRGIEEFSQMLREAGAGAKLDLKILRAFEGAPLNLTVELSGTKDPLVAMRRAETLLPRQPPGRLLNPLSVFGVETVGLTERSATKFGATGGLLVVNVHEGGPASAAGLRQGDVIETVNGNPLTKLQWKRLAETVSAELTLGVVRDGKRRIVKFIRPDQIEKH